MSSTAFATTRPDRSAAAWVLLCLAALVPALVTLPYLGAPPADVVSAAAAAGYSTRLAHLVAVAWLAATLAGAWILAARAGPA
ncbi:hypothetical protein, partial [Albidovulum sp.]